MPKFRWLLLSLSLFSTSSLAVEPELQQQGMFYFNVSFDAGYSKKTKHDFGFRVDRGLVKPGDSMRLSELNSKPAVFNLNYNNAGLQSFKIHGVDYTQEYMVARGAETGADEAATTDEAAPAEEAAAEAEAEPQEPVAIKRLNIPMGVYIGVLIGGFALAAGK